jgi:hypothetical protein
MFNSRKISAFAVACLAGSAGAYGLLAHGDAAGAQSPASAVSAPGGDACSSLVRFQTSQMVIASAQTQSAGGPIAGATIPGMTGPSGAGAIISGLPAFCRVTGSIHPVAGSDIHFEVWLPSAGWTGRLMGAGNGGLAGSISYIDLAADVKAGIVGAATDTGHSGSPQDSSWAKGHPERVRDYGWRAMHLTTLAAKTLSAGFYGHPVEHSYFASCSNGGRMALMEAARFPDDYDGILAGSPASSATKVIMTHIWVAQAQMAPGAAIRPDQIKLLQHEVLAQCDGLDGRVDGVVGDPRQCHFDAAKLACGVNGSAQCFTPPQLTALAKIYAGPRDRSGRQVAFGFTATGSEAGTPVPFFGWDGSIAKGGQKGAIQSSFPDVMLNLPPRPISDDAAFNFDRDPARVQASLAPETDPQPDLRRFFARGGKLVMWHGWADATIPPEYTLSFHQRILASSGPAARTQMRLFMVPGVQHCFGGPGPDDFGENGAPQASDTPDRHIGAAVIAWVEHNRAPQSLIGRLGLAGMTGRPDAGPEKQRLICAFPGKAVLTPGGDPDMASSYTCRS